MLLNVKKKTREEYMDFQPSVFYEITQ